MLYASLHGSNVCYIHPSFPCRLFAPTFAGSIYAVSLTAGLSFPLNYNLIFVLTGMSILIVIFMVASFPKSINKHKQKTVLEMEGGGGGNRGGGRVEEVEEEVEESSSLN